MEKILMYITNHYMIFVIAAGALIISAVGFIVEEKKQELNRSKDVPTDDEVIKEQGAKAEKKKK